MNDELILSGKLMPYILEVLKKIIRNQMKFVEESCIVFS